MKILFRIGLLLGTFGIVPLGAQPLSVDWFTVDGGGGTSSDGTLTLTGTAGQFDAGTLTAGTLTIQGGFWPAFATVSVPATNNSGYKIYYSTQSISPAGNYIGVINSDGSGNTQVIGSATWPRVSPDGSKLLYHPVGATDNFARNSIAILSLSPSNSTTIFTHGDYAVYYDWLRDGTNIVFDYTCGMYRIGTNGNNSAILFQVDCYDDAPSVNPQDGSLTFHNTHQGLLLANSDGSNRRLLPNTSAGDFWPNWSPDGQWIVFGNTNGFWKIKPDGSGKTNLWTHLVGATFPVFNSTAAPWPACFSPDQQWLVAAFNLNGTNGIYAIAADGSGTVQPILSAGNNVDQPYNFIGGVLPASLASLPRPVLAIVPAGAGLATLFWTPAPPGFILQESTNLSLPAWINSPSGAQNPTTVPTGGMKYYRLILPCAAGGFSNRIPFAPRLSQR